MHFVARGDLLDRTRRVFDVFEVRVLELPRRVLQRGGAEVMRDDVRGWDVADRAGGRGQHRGFPVVALAAHSGREADRRSVSNFGFPNRTYTGNVVGERICV